MRFAPRRLLLKHEEAYTLATELQQQHDPFDQGLLGTASAKVAAMPEDLSATSREASTDQDQMAFNGCAGKCTLVFAL